jgi:hypothetical protein
MGAASSSFAILKAYAMRASLSSVVASGMRLAALGLVCLTGCSAILDFDESQLVDGGGDAGRDGGSDAGDAGHDAALDAGPSAVACGASSCSVPAQECCLTSPAPACLALTDTCAGQVQRCDGPEDCTGGEVCCAQVPGSFILCRPYGTQASDCTGILSGSSGEIVLCHHSSDCPDRGVCQECPTQNLRFCQATLGAGCTEEP